MSKKLNFSEMLDFSEIDLTAPNKVVEEILMQLPKNTKNIICGSVAEYNGPVTSYERIGITLSKALTGLAADDIADIQSSLGKCGEENKKFECYLYTTACTNYKYRMFFMKYGIANYPVQFTLEESIARSIEDIKPNYMVSCNNRAEVEDLLIKILTSKKVLGVMQELIRIYQLNNTEEM